jgi:hypothetical protein
MKSKIEKYLPSIILIVIWIFVLWIIAAQSGTQTNKIEILEGDRYSALTLTSDFGSESKAQLWLVVDKEVDKIYYVLKSLDTSVKLKISSIEPETIHIETQEGLFMVDGIAESAFKSILISGYLTKRIAPSETITFTLPTLAGKQVKFKFTTGSVYRTAVIDFLQKVEPEVEKKKKSII